MCYVVVYGQPHRARPWCTTLAAHTASRRSSSTPLPTLPSSAHSRVCDSSNARACVAASNTPAHGNQCTCWWYLHIRRLPAAGPSPASPTMRAAALAVARSSPSALSSTCYHVCVGYRFPYLIPTCWPSPPVKHAPPTRGTACKDASIASVMLRTAVNAFACVRGIITHACRYQHAHQPTWSACHSCKHGASCAANAAACWSTRARANRALTCPTRCAASATASAAAATVASACSQPTSSVYMTTTDDYH